MSGVGAASDREKNMRTLLIAGLGAALVSPTFVDAQRLVQRGPGAGYGVPGRAPVMRPMPQRGNVVVVRPGQNGQRWQMRGGRWLGGWNAPGGWGAYRAPYVGYALPGYWMQPGFAISNWSAYGLARPAAGYNWYRYYDDAVLLDARGSVHDHVGGIVWDGYDGDYADADDVPVAPDHAGDDYRDRRDSGVGGAVAGAVGGGILGSAIAGRGDRLEGALIGAGVGAAAGYAIDKAEDRGRGGPPPRGYGAPYPAPGYGASARHGHGGNWVSPDGRTTVTTVGGGYGATTTTVVVQSAPAVTTTTTTEYYDDHVTYARPAARKTYGKVVKRKYRPSKTICRC
jgi:hypothetical protein